MEQKNRTKRGNISILIKGMEMPKTEEESKLLILTPDGVTWLTQLGLGNQKFDTIEVPGWIPVTERLPKEKGDYLVVFDCGHGAKVHEAFFYKYFDSWEWYDPVEEYQRYDVTHWMLLPEPPKEET